ncbi:hypothetical protein KJ751_01845 [Patescibacteria group bacterium]|nr:hypothetical protein [Patescibacteria group bacterium]
MEPQTIKVGDFSSILGATTKDGDFVHIASIETRKTACGKQPENFLLGRDFYLNCPECLAEIQYRHDHPEATKEDLGTVCHK